MSMYGKKLLQYCKVISLQLIKINKKKEMKTLFNFSEKYFLDNICLEVKNIVNYIQISVYLNALFPKWNCHFDQRTFRGVAVSL